jgi:hypothetical protein
MPSEAFMSTLDFSKQDDRDKYIQRVLMEHTVDIIYRGIASDPSSIAREPTQRLQSSYDATLSDEFGNALIVEISGNNLDNFTFLQETLNKAIACANDKKIIQFIVNYAKKIIREQHHNFKLNPQFRK